MNREAARKIAPIMQAYADGKDVQYKTSDGWRDSYAPTFDIRLEWRVKPDPIAFWAILNCKGGVVDTFTSREMAVSRINVRNDPCSPYPEWPYTLLKLVPEED